MKLLAYILRLVVRVISSLLYLLAFCVVALLFGNDAILALVLIKRWSWKNLRKKRKFFQDSLGGFVNSPYLCSGK